MDPVHVTVPEEEAPPPYQQTKHFNATLRPAEDRDATAIALIHKFWCEKTSVHTITETSMNERQVKTKMQTVKTLIMPFFVVEHPKLKTVLGFAYCEARHQPNEFSSTLFSRPPHHHLCAAQLFVYVAPEWLGQGLGQNLVLRIIRYLKEVTFMPRAFRGKGLPFELGKTTFLRFKTILVNMPVPGSATNVQGQHLKDAGLEVGLNTEEAHHKFWSALGFSEAGRLYSALMGEDEVIRDEWIWQKRL